jgi:uncharacterized YigZ family protein
MVSVNALFTDTIEIKGSKFIAFLMPIAVYEEQMTHLRAIHPKAVHWVSAYRRINEYDQIEEHSSDDGEPKGTSGKPTLSVLQGHDLINVALITVRYFGGTKLGPGGLVRAYAQAANAAYAHAVCVPYEKRLTHTVQCGYGDVARLEYEVLHHAIGIVSKAFDSEGATFILEGTQEHLHALYAVLGRRVRQA